MNANQCYADQLNVGDFYRFNEAHPVCQCELVPPNHLEHGSGTDRNGIPHPLQDKDLVTVYSASTDSFTDYNVAEAFTDHIEETGYTVVKVSHTDRWIVHYVDLKEGIN